MSKKRVCLVLLLVWGISLVLTPPLRVKAVDEYEISNAIADVYIYFYPGEAGDFYYDIYIKWNVSTIPKGRTVQSATMYLYFESIGADSDGDMDAALVLNQDWTESTSPQTLHGYSKSDLTSYTGISGTGYHGFNILQIFQSNYGDDYLSLRIRDPDHPVPVEPNTRQNLAYLLAGKYKAGDEDTRYQITSRTGSSGQYPYLEVVLASIPAGTFQVYYDFPTETDMTSYITPESIWNSTQLLYRALLFPYEAGTNVTISGIPTTYAFEYINPNCSDFSDTINANGQLVVKELKASTYEVVFDPGQNWHTLHVSLYASDGVGLMWESFQIYINNTRVPYPPEYRLESGYYEYEIKDYFEQTVKTGTFTVYATDSEDVYQNWEVPLYAVSFHNGDPAPYRIEITRNAITRKFPLPPKGDSIMRLYGLATNVEYTIEIYNTENGQRMDRYTLSVPNAPVSKYANYDDDEAIDFPSYNWIEDGMIALNSRITGQNQLIFIGFMGILLAIAIQVRGWWKGLFKQPLVRDKRRR